MQPCRTSEALTELSRKGHEGDSWPSQSWIPPLLNRCSPEAIRQGIHVGLMASRMEIQLSSGPGLSQGLSGWRAVKERRAVKGWPERWYGRLEGWPSWERKDGDCLKVDGSLPHASPEDEM